MGKTALALKVAYDVLDHERNPFDAIVWSSSKTHQLTPQEIVRIDNAISDSLGLLSNAATQIAGTTDNPIPDLLDFMSQFKILLILDNLETVLDQRIRDFLKKLPSGSKVLLTSRLGLGYLDYPEKVDPFDPLESVAYLRAVAASRGASQLVKTNNAKLGEFCVRMNHNPLHIKWFVSAVCAGKRPEEVLAKPDLLLDFCMSNVYTYLSPESQRLIRAMLSAQSYHSFAELAFLTDIPAIVLRESIHQIMSTSMVGMISKPRGSSFESRFGLAELARKYLQKHHPLAPEEHKKYIKKRQDLNFSRQELDAERKSDVYSALSIAQSSNSDVIVARYLIEALKHVKGWHLDDAENAVIRAKELAPEYFEVFRVDAWVKNAKGNTVGAQESYDAAIELEPNWAPLRLFYGQFLLRAFNDLDGAMTQLDIASKLDPVAYPIKIEATRVLLYRGDFDDSRKRVCEILAATDIPEWARRKAYDLYLQSFQREAEFAVGRHDLTRVTAALANLWSAFCKCPDGLVDVIMKEKLKKGVAIADRCCRVLEEGNARSSLVAIRNEMERAAGGRTLSPDNLRSPPLSENARRGKIKRLIFDKGFGFIAGDDGTDYFFHKSAVRDGMWLTLEEGLPVLFDLSGKETKISRLQVVPGEVST